MDPLLALGGSANAVKRLTTLQRLDLSSSVLQEARRSFGAQESNTVPRNLVPYRWFAADEPEGRRLLEAAITLAPGSIRPRMVLGQCYLVEGRDPGAAEQALNDVLRLDPSNAIARQNLSALLARQGKAQV